jgi:hypothetical protein
MGDISQIFLEDHKKILETITHFKQLVEKRDETALPDFQKKLRWECERHFYIEEKALYIYREVDEEFDDIFQERLIREHDQLLNLLSKIELKPTLTKIKTLIKIINLHVAFESQFFYTQLEQNLSEQHRKSILKHITQATTLGFFPLTRLREYYSNRKNIQKKTDN